MDILFDFPPSPSPTFIGRRHTPHTPRFDLRRTACVRFAPGTGPYTAVKQAYGRVSAELVTRANKAVKGINESGKNLGGFLHYGLSHVNGERRGNFEGGRRGAERESRVKDPR